MYSILRDRYSRGATALQLSILLASFFLLVLSLASDALVARLMPDPATARDWAVILATLVFAVSILDMHLDWRGRAGAYREAAQHLYGLKAKYRSAFSQDPVSIRTLQVLREEYAAVNERLPGIPERYFLGLKAAHKRKVALSKLLDSYPSVPIWVLRVRLLWRELRGRDV
jgi:hypothetical protein